jgi:hypothetical protein
MVGAVMWFASLAHRFVQIGDLQRHGVLLVAGFVAAQLARRALVELELGATVMASVIAMAIVIGMFAQRRYQAMDLDMLIPFGITAAGVLLGASTARRRAARVSRASGVLAGGFAALGAMLSISGAIDLISTQGYVVLATLLGAAIGAFVFVLCTPVPPAHCAFGVALVSATTAMNATEPLVMITGALIGFLLGWVVGAIGAGIGSRIRDGRAPRPDLPAAHVR